MEDTVQEESPREYYVWQPPDKPFTIQLAFDVIDRMNVEIMRGFGAVRRRGTEVGGVLLGRIEPVGDHTYVTIDDYEPVPCEYAFGPSYILSTDDLQVLRKALASFDPSAGRDLYTVGFYRSHTRDGLFLDNSDLKFFREYFPDPLHVALLIKPFATRAGLAGFFVEEADSDLSGAASSLEFPFRRKDLQPRPEESIEAPPEPERPASRRPHPVPMAFEEVARETEQEQEPEPVAVAAAAAPIYQTKPIFADYGPEPGQSRSKVGWWIFALMLVVFGGVFGYQYSGALMQTSAVSSSSDPYSLNLSASRVDDNILVKWDRQSLAVKGGWRGLLTITEGTDSKSVQMDVPQLQNGTVLYRHIAAEIHFRLEVFLKEQRSVVETYTWRMD
ncbi:MAG: hypothetical protein ABJF23_02730 [Bryobacteraceae bacterium]